MNILHLVPPSFGGIDAYIFSHYKYIDQSKFHFDFLTRNPALENAAQYREYPYHVRWFPSTAAEDRDGFAGRMLEIFRGGYDALHLHTSFWTGTLLEELAREAGIRKVIVHSHSSYIEENDAERRNFLLRQHEEIKGTITEELATDFWACSGKAAGWLFGGRIPKDRVRILKNAIEVERYRFDPEKRRSLRRELGVESALVFGTVGRISYQKNHAFLVDAFAEVHRRHPEARLLLVGDGELRDGLERQIEAYRLKDAVLLPGWKTNVEDYLHAMDCFLLPSRFEGLSIAALEAMASGLPCVISDRLAEETDLSEDVRRVPLEVPRWAAAMEAAAERRTDREAGVEIVRAAGYDVRRQAKVLERMYEA